MFEIHCLDRWQAYQRLLELGLECHCRSYAPLWVRVDSPSQALQVWSTTQWISQSRSLLRQRLERCWVLEAGQLTA